MCTLKKRNQSLAFLQRTRSTFLYANGASKKVYKCLQPLMLCQSYEATIDTIDRIVKHYNKIPLLWKNELLQYLPTAQDFTGQEHFFPNLLSESECSETSFATPPYSPIDTSFECEEECNPATLNVKIQEVLQDDTAETLAQPRSEQPEGPQCSTTEPDPCSIASESLGSSLDSTSDGSTSEPHCSTSEPHSGTSEPHSGASEPHGTSLESQCSTSEPHGSSLESQDSTSEVGMQQGCGSSDRTVEMENDNTGWPGFKIVGDNIDKNFRPLFQRHDNSTNSMHAFHMYAVQDRVDLSSYSDFHQPSCIEINKLLIRTKDIDLLTENAVVLLSRILVQHIKVFSSQKKYVMAHIPSKFIKEMSMKSKVVPLGVLQRNENKINEMCEIMDEIQKYVSAKSVTAFFPLFHEEDDIEYDDEVFHKMLLGGDQVTVARARGSIAARADHHTQRARLQGLLPVVEDWHAKQCLLKAIWKHSFKGSSSTEKGTLSQFKVLLNVATSVDPEKNMKACEDFFLIVLHAHVVAAGTKLMEKQQYGNVQDLAKAIIQTFVNFDPDKKNSRKDKIHVYGAELLTLGIIWHNFNDSIHEGDGYRVLLCWKFMLVIFRVKGHRNYCKEALTLLIQYNFLLSDRKAAQLKWSHFVNTSGKQGGNIPCDLHLEHLNRRLKGMITKLNSNASGNSTSIYPINAVNRAARSIGLLNEVCDLFEKQNKVSPVSGNHNKPSLETDVQLIVDVLKDIDVFETKQRRKHHSFANINHILQQCPSGLLKSYILPKLDINCFNY